MANLSAVLCIKERVKVFKSVFVKYMVCFLLIFAISFSMLFFIFIGMVSTNERTNSVVHAAESVKVMVDRAYTEYIQVDESRDYFSFIADESESLNMQISGIADCTNTVIFIANPNGKIAAWSNGSKLQNKSISKSIINQVYSSERSYSFTGTADGLFSEEYGFNAIELSTGDNHGVVFAAATTQGMSDFVSDMIGTMAKIAILVLIAGMIGCYFISERIVVPLRNMDKAAKSFAAGKFDVRVQVVGKDEIAGLAATMNSMAESLSELEALRSGFLANVSHDLRTPMTIISGYIDGILDGAIPKEKHEYYLGIVATEVRRLSRLVGTLLDISRIQAGDRKFNIREFDICQKAVEVMLSNESRIEAKELEVDIDLEKDKMLVLADSDSIHQVIYNLVDNAIKFSYDKGLLRVRVTQKDSKNVKIEVYNEGKGIAKDELKYVFDRFYKADKSRGLDKSGVGLGLYISRTIVEAMNGNISVDSEEGKWCCFTVVLPTP